MKKGVFCNCVSFILILVLFSLLVFPVLAVPGSTSQGGSGDGYSGPQPTDPVRGYWVAKCRTPPPNAIQEICGEWFNNVGQLTSSCYLSTAHNAPCDFIDLEEKDIYALSGLKNVQPLKEIESLIFVLDPWFFTLAGTQFSSHGVGVQNPLPAIHTRYNYFETGCTTCDSIDNLNYEKCLKQDAPGKFDNSCFELNILDRKNCSEQADYNQEFCEGIFGVGGNAQSSVDPRNPGVSGYGGCQQYPDMVSSSSFRKYGRDWSDSSNGPSVNFLISIDDKSKIGRCCGNDAQDSGALGKGAEAVASYPNRLICFNDTKVNPAGDFKWADARATDMLFRIINVNNSVFNFDAVSNGMNWFICDGSESHPMSSIYRPVILNNDEWAGGDNGVLIYEYKGIPEVSGYSEEAGITIMDETAGIGSGDGAEPFSGAGGAKETLIDQDAFSNTAYGVTGATEITACDKDGDGYDGNWSIEETASLEQIDGVVMRDPSNNPCKNPRLPFDCDDGSYETGHFELTDVSGFKHPGRSNYCVDGVDKNLDCANSGYCIPDPNTKTVEDIFNNPLSNHMFINPRFVCHGVDSKSEFAECCGWDLGFCFNPQKGRREGSAIHTLRDFDRYPADNVVNNNLLNKTNFVLRYGINDPNPQGTYTEGEYTSDDTFGLKFFTKNSDSVIYDWSKYDALEFYVWLTANYELELWIGSILTAGDCPEYTFDTLPPTCIIYPFKKRITDYVVNEPGLKKWMHVIVPVSDIMQAPFKPDVIRFSSNVLRLIGLSKVTIPEGTFSNVVGLDKISLRPKQGKVPGGDNLYCSGTWPPIWISELDDKTTSLKVLNANPGAGAQPTGRDACNSIPSYGWTGGMCCGDDTNKTFKEFYNDTLSGCWGGNLLAEDARVMMIKYGLFSQQSPGEVIRSCTNTSCTFEIPQTQGILVTNEYSDVYDLSFVGTQGYPIGPGRLSPGGKKLYLKAENFPFEVMYHNGSFWSCDAEDYISELTNTIAGGLLIPDGNNLTSIGNMCAVAGPYFCDREDGADTGWNSEGLAVYPGTNNYPGSNITMRDGTQKQFAEGENNIDATWRNEAKRNYNLIRNGGFENV